MGSIIDKAKGKAKEIEGRVTGDKLRTGQGKAERTKGEAEGMVERAKTRVRAGVARAKAKARTSRARASSRSRTRSA